MKVWDAYVCSFCIWSLPFTLPETNILHQKMDHWKRRFPLDTIIFRGYVSFREGVGRILQIIDFRYLVDQPVTYLLIRALVEFQSSLPAMSSACPAYFFGTSSSIHGVVGEPRSGSAAETPKKDTQKSV